MLPFIPGVALAAAAAAATPLPLVGGALIGAVVGAATKNQSKESSNAEECTVYEAAEILGLSEYTVKKKIREGALRGRIVGKKYMVSRKSIEEYLKEAGKSGQILGISPLDGAYSELWNDIASLQTCVDQIKLQQEILSLECKKLEFEKKLASKNNDEDQVNEICKQILDKNIQIVKCSQTLKLCEAQILFLTKQADKPKDE